MDIFLDLVRDSDNSYPGRMQVAVIETDSGKRIQFSFTGPDREIVVDLRKLKRALAALEDES